MRCASAKGGSSVSGFEKIYTKLVEPQGASPQLRPFLRELYVALTARPADLPRMKHAMIQVLEFLASPTGRTHENCKAADLFLCIDDWERDWHDLPQSFINILEDMGGSLHDTIRAPDIAANFGSTPEQLLERTKELDDRAKAG